MAQTVELQPIHVENQQNIDQSEMVSSLDNNRFYDNVFTNPQPAHVTQTRSGRNVIPVIGTRLIDQVNFGLTDC